MIILEATKQLLSNGVYLAILGAALAAAMAGIGSALGVSRAGQAAAAVTAENPDLFSKVLVLQLLPATQGIYGFLIAIMVFLKINAFGEVYFLTMDQGMQMLMACLPIAFAGFFSAIYQAKVAVSGMNMISKRPESSGQAITMTVMVETYAILALLVSFLLVFLGVGNTITPASSEAARQAAEAAAKLAMMVV